MAEEEDDEATIVRDDCDDGDDGLTAKEVLKEAFDHLTEEIKQFVANQGGGSLLGQRQSESTNSNNHPTTSTTSITSNTTSTTSGKHRLREPANVKPSQRDVAGDLLEMIQRSQQHITPENFDYFDMFIIIPKFICLG